MVIQATMYLPVPGFEPMYSVILGERVTQWQIIWQLAPYIRCIKNMAAMVEMFL